MKKVIIYTDGACSGNPGPGGWASILIYKESKKVLSGGEKQTTNNRMELTAVIKALEALKEPCVVEIFSDSKYIVDAVNLGWAISWKNNGWKKKDKKQALNIDLWDTLLNLIDMHEVTFNWVKGHANNEYNNECDEIAVKQRDKYSLE